MWGGVYMLCVYGIYNVVCGVYIMCVGYTVCVCVSSAKDQYHWDLQLTN